MARSHQKTLRANNINRAQRQAAANYIDNLERAIAVIARERADHPDRTPLAVEEAINVAVLLTVDNNTDGEYVRP